MMNLRTLKNMDRDDVLALLGLETRRGAVDYILPTVGIFSIGLLVGAGIGLLLAPKSGRELMDDLRTRMSGQSEEMAGSFGTNSQGIERTPRTV
jgi:hypothetical protein